MEFVTIHDLSTHFDVPARVIRYRFHQLRLAGKLIDDQDFRRDDFVDEQHFEWKINPVSFGRETGMRPVTKTVTIAPPSATKVDNQPPPFVTTPPNSGYQVVPTVDTKTTGLEREMIDLLKDQVRVKDGQIDDLTHRVRDVTDLNMKLVGQTLQQSQRIQDLLRLTGGKIDLSEVVTKSGDDSLTKDNKTDREAVNHGQQTDTNVGNQPPTSGTKIADTEFGKAA